MTDAERIKEFLVSAEHMVLAVTRDDGTPWAVPVKIQLQWGVAFEWDSAVDSLHSKALISRPDAAISLYMTDGDSQLGVYARGKAALVEERGRSAGRYRFIAAQMWMNDETHVKREVPLDEIINQTED